VGDPRKGKFLSLSLLKTASETRGWLARYRKNKTGLDPVSFKIDNIAQSQIDEQRKALRDQVDPIYNNSLAQLQNGKYLTQC
jgi:hypothetical protein